MVIKIEKTDIIISSNNFIMNTQMFIIQITTSLDLIASNTFPAYMKSYYILIYNYIIYNIYILLCRKIRSNSC